MPCCVYFVILLLQPEPFSSNTAIADEWELTGRRQPGGGCDEGGGWCWQVLFSPNHVLHLLSSAPSACCMRACCVGRPLASPRLAPRSSSPLRAARMTCAPLLAYSVAHQPSNVSLPGPSAPRPLAAHRPLTPLPASLPRLSPPAALLARVLPCTPDAPFFAARPGLVTPLPWGSPPPPTLALPCRQSRGPACMARG